MHDKPLFLVQEILLLPPSALQGLTPKADALLREHLKIATIKDLGAFKYFKVARAIATLAASEVIPSRGISSPF